MPKVMVFNFETEKFEEATQEEGQELLDLLDALNQDCVDAHED